MKSSVFKDFKSTFLRLSFIAFLSAFVTVGMFSTYWYLHTIPQAEFNNLNVVFTRTNTSVGWQFIGLVFNNQADPISNAKVTVVCPSSTKVYYTNSSGYFSIYCKSPSMNIIVSYKGQQKSIFINVVYPVSLVQPITVKTTYASKEYVTLYESDVMPSILPYSPPYAYANVSPLYNYFSEGFAIITEYNGNTAKVITFLPNVTLYFYNSCPHILTNPPIKNGLIGNVSISQPLKTYTIAMSKGTSAIIASHESMELGKLPEWSSSTECFTVSPIVSLVLNYLTVPSYIVLLFLLEIGISVGVGYLLRIGSLLLKRKQYRKSFSFLYLIT